MELSHENLPAGWKYGVNLNYTYATGRAPMIKLEQTMPLYSLPDSVSLIINTKGEIGFEKIILGMRPNHESALKSLQIEQLTPATGDIQISFGVGEITDVPNDKLSYPLWFNYMSFYLTPSTQTAGKKNTRLLSKNYNSAIIVLRLVSQFYVSQQTYCLSKSCKKRRSLMLY